MDSGNRPADQVDEQQENADYEEDQHGGGKSDYLLTVRVGGAEVGAGVGGAGWKQHLGVLLVRKLGLLLQEVLHCAPHT